MPRTANTLLANSLEPMGRSFLLFLGLDHALIDFLVITAIGAATILLTILFVSARVPSRPSALPPQRIPDSAV